MPATMTDLLINFEFALSVTGSILNLLAPGVMLTRLGVVFLMPSAPTSAASYVMSPAMGANAALAASIIVLSILGSVAVTGPGITLLRGKDLI